MGWVETQAYFNNSYEENRFICGEYRGFCNKYSCPFRADKHCIIFDNYIGDDIGKLANE